MKKLLVVVDFQNDFVDGSLGFEKAVELDDIIYNKISTYKKNDDDVIYTFDTHYDDYLETEEGKKLPIAHCLKYEHGHDLYGKVKSLFDENIDIYFEKTTFPSLDLANYLTNKNYKEIEVCGLVSNICVLSNVIMIKSALPNAAIAVDRKATSSFDEVLNEYCFQILKGLFVNVI